MGTRRRFTPPPPSAGPPERCPHCGAVRALCSRDRTGRCDDLTRLAIRAIGPEALAGHVYRVQLERQWQERRGGDDPQGAIRDVA